MMVATLKKVRGGDENLRRVRESWVWSLKPRFPSFFHFICFKQTLNMIESLFCSVIGQLQ